MNSSFGSAEPSRYTTSSSVRTFAAESLLRLDTHTTTDHAYMLTIYPSACEAVVTHNRSLSKRPRLFVDRPSSAGQRARTKIRHYAVGNGLTHFVTLNVRADSPSVIRVDSPSVSGVERCVKSVIRPTRRALGKAPYVYVIEGGIDVRPHAHLLVQRKWAYDLKKRWPEGFTNVKVMRSVNEIRASADYVAKDFADDPLRGLRNRYSVGRGFAIHPERVSVSSVDEARSYLEALTPRSAVIERHVDTPLLTAYRW